MKKRALITGITGQDASYLAEFLLDRNYEVTGMFRRSSTENTERIVHLGNRIQLMQGDLLDQSSLMDIVREVGPDEVYNLAAQSFVPASWKQPEYTGDVTGLGVLRMLEALRTVRSPARFYQASSSEMFGKVAETPQHEKTPFYPRSPYGVAKVYGHYITINYRESYGMFACSGILFNHESERRGLEFVTRKITHHVVRQALGLTNQPLELGNLNAERDWGHAADYVRAMWLMLQQDEPDDYVIATGVAHTVREFVEEAYAAATGVRMMTWEGKGLSELGVFRMDDTCSWSDQSVARASNVRKCGRETVKVRPQFYRPAEVQALEGDASKAHEDLGWEPKISFEQLVSRMVEADIKRLSRA